MKKHLENLKQLGQVADILVIPADNKSAITKKGTDKLYKTDLQKDFKKGSTGEPPDITILAIAGTGDIDGPKKRGRKPKLESLKIKPEPKPKGRPKGSPNKIKTVAVNYQEGGSSSSASGMVIVPPPVNVQQPILAL